jgi:hypothetical protein
MPHWPLRLTTINPSGSREGYPGGCTPQRRYRKGSSQIAWFSTAAPMCLEGHGIWPTRSLCDFHNRAQIRYDNHVWMAKAVRRVQLCPTTRTSLNFSTYALRHLSLFLTLIKGNWNLISAVQRNFFQERSHCFICNQCRLIVSSEASLRLVWTWKASVICLSKVQRNATWHKGVHLKNTWHVHELPRTKPLRKEL